MTASASFPRGVCSSPPSFRTRASRVSPPGSARSGNNDPGSQGRKEGKTSAALEELRRDGLPAGSALALAALTALATACASPPPAAEPASPPPPVEARATVDRAVATTGDLITYTVTVEHDPDLAVTLPEPGSRIAGFRIVDVGREEPREVGGRIVEERWYRLRADLVGSYVLPPVTVTYRQVGQVGTDDGVENAAGEEAESAAGDGGATREGSIETSEIFVEVESVLPADGEAADIRDLKPLVPPEDRPPWVWIAAGGGGLLLAAGLFAAWWWRRRPPRPATPPVPAHEVAFAALDALRRTDFTDPAAVRRYYFALSEVVRTYVEARWGLNATDLTTEEILVALHELRGLPREPAGELRRFLRETDQVKFASHRPSEPEIAEAYERALSFVEATRPQPLEPESGEAPAHA